MKQIPKLVIEKEELTQIVEKLAQCDLIGLDTEFIRESTFYPKIALIQIATRTEVFLLDPLAFEKEDLEDLFKVLADPKILKVIHAAYADQECFYWEYGVTVAPVLDTAVAAAMLGMGDNIGLSKLLKDVLHVNLPKGRARAKWLARPLSSELLEYAVKDVDHLVELSEKLIDKLNKKNRFDWAVQKSFVDPSEWDEDPEVMAKRITRNSHLDARGRGAFVELMIWREGKARDINLPRNWIASNETLLALAKSKPTTIEDLHSFRGLSKKEVEKSGQEIIKRIVAGSEKPVEVKKHAPEKTVKNESAKIALLQAFVQLKAEEIGIAARMLLTQDKAASLLRNSDGGKKHWSKLGILDASSEDMIGGDLEDLIAGKIVLKFENGEINVSRID